MRRPDFLDGLGVYVGATDVAIAGVSKRLLRVRLREARSVPLPPRDQVDARRQALAGAVRDFVTTHEIDTSHTVLCVPRSDAAVTRVLLPAAAQENLEQVLEYEMENLVPLPREEIFFDYTVRPLGAERIEVLLVCVPRDVINGYLAALDEAGVKPRSIGLPSTALADYVTFCRGDVALGMGVVVQATDATEIALFSQGRLVASQLVPAPNASEPRRARALAPAPARRRALRAGADDALPLVARERPRAGRDRARRGEPRRDGERQARHRRRGVRARDARRSCPPSAPRSARCAKASCASTCCPPSSARRSTKGRRSPRGSCSR